MTPPERESVLALARRYPEMFDIRDGQIFVRPGAEGEPCPCCGKTLKGSPLPRVTYPPIPDPRAER